MLNFIIFVVACIIAYLYSRLGFKNIKIALSIISKKYVLMPLASALLWAILLAVPYILINKYYPSLNYSLLLGYLSGLLFQFYKAK